MSAKRKTKIRVKKSSFWQSAGTLLQKTLLAHESATVNNRVGNLEKKGQLPLEDLIKRETFMLMLWPSRVEVHEPVVLKLAFCLVVASLSNFKSLSKTMAFFFFFFSS